MLKLPHKLRNVFHQYTLNENRLTHGLAHVLISEPSLLSDFLLWATGYSSKSDPSITVQDGSGNQDSIPDITVKDGTSYICAIEVKLYPNKVDTGQITKHWIRYSDVKVRCVLLITPDSKEPRQIAEVRKNNFGINIAWRSWQDIYSWLRGSDTDNFLKSTFCDYMQQMEGILLKEGYLVMLTTFEGISFDNNEFDYDKARAFLNHLKKQLESSPKLRKTFPGLNPELSRKIVDNWTSIGLITPQNKAYRFNNHPHLTISFEEEEFSIYIVLPYAASTEYKSRSRKASQAEWQETFQKILDGLSSLKLTAGSRPSPFVQVMQRHWLSRRTQPITDAEVEFSLNTLVSKNRLDKKVKENPSWASVMSGLIKSSRNANIECQVGLHYPYNSCKQILNSPKFSDHLALATATLLPFFELITTNGRH